MTFVLVILTAADLYFVLCVWSYAQGGKKALADYEEDSNRVFP